MRSGGILLHISSLPSAGGIGDLGKEAYAFADFLKNSGMRIWQVLPVCPTGYGESPYQAPSAFAGNPLLISLEKLREEGYLDFSDAELICPLPADQVNYEAVRKLKTALLHRAWEKSRACCAEELEVFRRQNPWAWDYALFAAVKEHFGQTMWSSWPDPGIRNHKAAAVQEYQRELQSEIGFHLFCQFIFDRQWAALKKYCNHRGISLLGDLPIYVAEDSADTWTHPEVFQLNRNRMPIRVAGVPPDAFSDDGQLWGNPLYRWHSLRWRGYGWWVDRMKRMTSLFDIVRIDHFIGFANYYSIPYGAPNARNGKWVIGPGKKLFRKLNKRIPGMRIVAEDLGEVTDRVRNLMRYCGYPGMKILLYGFDGDSEQNEHYPSHYSENYAAYTGTHDNDTVLGWALRTSPQSLQKAKSVLNFELPEEAPWAFVRAVFSSPCDTAIVPMQDVLSLDNRSRMNLPGTVGGNWQWRMLPGLLTQALESRLLSLNRETHRCD